MQSNLNDWGISDALNSSLFNAYSKKPSLFAFRTVELRLQTGPEA